MRDDYNSHSLAWEILDSQWKTNKLLSDWLLWSCAICKKLEGLPYDLPPPPDSPACRVIHHLCIAMGIDSPGPLYAWELIDRSIQETIIDARFNSHKIFEIVIITSLIHLQELYIIKLFYIFYMLYWGHCAFYKMSKNYVALLPVIW